MSTADPWSASGWRDAAIDYHQARNGRPSITPYTADELARLRRLMADDVSYERAWREFSARAPGDVPLATLRTAEHLAFIELDRKRFKDWLARHDHEDRDAIIKHLAELAKKRDTKCQ